MGFRVRLGKNLSYGKSGLRVNGKVGGVRISSGRSGTYLGAGAGPVRYNTRLKSGGKTRARSVTPALLRSAPGSPSAVTSKAKTYIHKIPKGWYIVLTILLAAVVGQVPFVGPLLAIASIVGSIVWAKQDTRQRD